MSASLHQAEITRAIGLLGEAHNAVALTGAGMSTESGIPDFRSPGGVWTKYDPDEFSYQKFTTRPESRAKYWKWGLEFFPTVRGATPHAGYDALVALAKQGRLRCVITQNVDGLHRRAGSPEVIEIHGTALEVGCLACGQRWPREAIHARLEAEAFDPRCACGGILKPCTISFGQPMPKEETTRAYAEARRADVFLALGSSLVVFPAADLVPEAVEHGAKLIVINLEPTPFDGLATVAIHAKVGEALPAILEGLS